MNIKEQLDVAWAERMAYPDSPIGEPPEVYSGVNIPEPALVSNSSFSYLCNKNWARTVMHLLGTDAIWQWDTDSPGSCLVNNLFLFISTRDEGPRIYLP